MSEEAVSTDGQARRRREEGCQREEAIRALLKRRGDKRHTIVDVEAVAWELGVSRSTMYRLITPYQAIREAWAKDPAIFKINPHHLIPETHTPRVISEQISRGDPSTRILSLGSLTVA
jgi:hypothetical protein